MKVQGCRKWLFFLPIYISLLFLRMATIIQQPSIIAGGVDSTVQLRQNKTDSYHHESFWPTPISDQQPAIYFIHVGKAGGMTLRQYLPIPLAEKKRELMCWRKHSKNQTSAKHCFAPPHANNYSALTNHIRGHFHIGSSFFSEDEKQFLLENTDTFLFDLRNPIDRIVSAFHYHQNQSIPYPLFDCFHTMQDLLQAIQEKDKDDCSTLARQVLLGNSSAGGIHFPYNYQYYEGKTTLDKADHFVAVIRTEHLWQDTRELDVMLGGRGRFEGFGKQYSHYNSQSTDVSAVTAAIARNPSMCCILANEIASYQRLLLRAINLRPAQKQESLERVLHRCGILVLDYPNSRAATPYPLVSNPFPWNNHYNSTEC
jgi:hypothetical protein